MTDDTLPENLRAYVEKVERALAEAGVEPVARHGVIRDLEGQIAEMRAEEGMSEDAILKSLDTPETFAETYVGKPAEGKSAADKPAAQQSQGALDTLTGMVCIAVALLAGAAILVELTSRMCALNIFNPIPTYLHLLVIAMTPVLLLLTYFWMLRGSAVKNIGRLFLANGYLAAVGLGYAAVFVPIMPVALLTVIFYGFGLLPLSPAIVFLSSMFIAFRLWRQAKQAGIKGMWKHWLAGFVIPVILLGGWHGYTALLDQAITMANGDGAVAREAGVSRIRMLGGEHYVLANCFPRDNISWRRNSSMPANRILYYRLTGKDYREEKRSFLYFSPSLESFLSRAPSRRGASVFGENSENLSLRSAVYDISIASGADGADAGPGVAYAELTLDFANSGKLNEEASCQIIMPPGSVASRLTLWIDGEEREAAFGKKNVVREAYDRVVRRNMDPALLTTAGPDRVRLQCFPVLAGKTMKVKAGFSTPLSPEGGEAKLRLPYIAERNFSLALDKGVSVWAESDARMSGNDVLRDDSAQIGEKKSRHAIRRHVALDDLSKTAISLPLPAAPASYRAQLSGVSAVSSLVVEEAMGQRVIAVVIDVSSKNKTIWKPGGGKAVPWESVLKNMPGGCKAALFAGEVSLPPMFADEAAQKWPQALSRISYAGADERQGSNLEKAWDECDGKPGAVLWLHGAMPLNITDTSGLEQRLRRRPPSAGGPTVFSLQMQPGINRLEESLAGCPGFVRLASRFDESAAKHLSDLFADLAFPSLTRQRYVFSLGENTDDSETRYGHVARLAAAHDVEQRLSRGARDEKAIEAAIDRALILRLVTSATGAVVLENEAQYKQHSLDAGAASDSVPTIPEPEEWAMLAIAAALVGFVYYQRRKRKVWA